MKKHKHVGKKIDYWSISKNTGYSRKAMLKEQLGTLITNNYRNIGYYEAHTYPALELSEFCWKITQGIYEEAEEN
jgi:hypothetical protein